MFSLTASEVGKLNNARAIEFLSRFDDSDEIFQGDAGDWLIGSAGDLDEDDAAAYDSIGTVAEYAAGLRQDQRVG